MDNMVVGLHIQSQRAAWHYLVAFSVVRMRSGDENSYYDAARYRRGRHTKHTREDEMNDYRKPA